MNLYILVDAKETERHVYKKWLGYLLPELKEVTGFDEITQYNYFLRHAKHKAPSFRNRLKASILEINEANGYSYFVICLDAEERTIEETITGVDDILEELNKKENVRLLKNVKLEIIVQNKCIETWFLGNPRMITRNPHNKILVEYIRHYDVSVNDPEKMPLPSKSRFNTTAQFHFDYLRLLFAEKSLTYSKDKLGDVLEPYYLEQLQRRIHTTNHLLSFKRFNDLCLFIKQKLHPL